MSSRLRLVLYLALEKVQYFFCSTANISLQHASHMSGFHYIAIYKPASYT